MTTADFLSEIDKIIQSGRGTVALETPLSGLGGWDSMAIISFIAMADAKLGVSIRVADLSACNTVGDLAGLCKITGN